MNENDAIAVITAAWTIVRLTALTLQHRRARQAAALKAAKEGTPS